MSTGAVVKWNCHASGSRWRPELLFIPRLVQLAQSVVLLTDCPVANSDEVASDEASSKGVQRKNNVIWCRWHKVIAAVGRGADAELSKTALENGGGSTALL